MEITAKPFAPEGLEMKLKELFPQYLIKRMGKRISVRKKKFTLTQQLSLGLKPAQGKVICQNSLTFAYMFLTMGVMFSFIFSWFYLVTFSVVAIYIFLKTSKIKAFEKEVMDKLPRILNQEYRPGMYI